MLGAVKKCWELCMALMRDLARSALGNRAAIRKGVLKKVMFLLKVKKEEGFNE